MNFIRTYFIVAVTAAAYIFPFVLHAESQLGASLYIAPLPESPRVGENFTASIKVDSLAEPVNAVRGVLQYDKERLEVITTSKIGSILNLWIEEPRFSNADGTIRFQGGVPKPGFIGGGGVILHVIFRAKGVGIPSLVWKEGEVLAADGKGTNILVNLQNLNFSVEPSLTAQPSPSGVSGIFSNAIVVLNMILLGLFFCIGIFFVARIFSRQRAEHTRQDIRDIVHQEYEYHAHHAEETSPHEGAVSSEPHGDTHSSSYLHNSS